MTDPSVDPHRLSAHEGALTRRLNRGRALNDAFNEYLAHTASNPMLPPPRKLRQLLVENQKLNADFYNDLEQHFQKRLTEAQVNPEVIPAWTRHLLDTAKFKQYDMIRNRFFEIEDYMSKLPTSSEQKDIVTPVPSVPPTPTNITVLEPDTFEPIFIERNPFGFTRSKRVPSQLGFGQRRVPIEHRQVSLEDVQEHGFSPANQQASSAPNNIQEGTFGQSRQVYNVPIRHVTNPMVQPPQFDDDGQGADDQNDTFMNQYQERGPRGFRTSTPIVERRSSPYAPTNPFLNPNLGQAELDETIDLERQGYVVNDQSRQRPDLSLMDGYDQNRPPSVQYDQIRPPSVQYEQNRPPMAQFDRPPPAQQIYRSSHNRDQNVANEIQVDLQRVSAEEAEICRRFAEIKRKQREQQTNHVPADIYSQAAQPNTNQNPDYRAGNGYMASPAAFQANGNPFYMWSPGPTGGSPYQGFQMPIFNGTGDFGVFKRRFEQTVEHIPGMERYNASWLRTHLRDRPSRIIDEMTEKRPTFQQIMDCLTATYGNSMYQLRELWQSFGRFTIDNSSSQSLLECLSFMKSRFMQLNDMGVEGDHFSSAQRILEQFPVEIQDSVWREAIKHSKRSGSVWKLNDWCESIESHINSRTRSLTDTQKKGVKQPQYHNSFPANSENPQAVDAFADINFVSAQSKTNSHSAMNANASSQGKNSKNNAYQQNTGVFSKQGNLPLCPMQDGNHYVKYCPKTISEKLEICQKQKLCHICFVAGHNSSNCSGNSCPICKGRHHSVLCPEKVNQAFREGAVPGAAKPDGNKPTPKFPGVPFGGVAKQ